MKETPLNDQLFSYLKSKDGQIRIFHKGRLANSIRGKEAVKFLSKTEILDDQALQLLMAKATGQFKFGNEKAGKQLARGK